MVTELFAPAVATAAIGAMVAFAAAPTPASGLLWAAVAVLFGAAIPLGFLLLGQRRGWWTDHHVPDPAHRRWPIAVAVASVLTGAAVGAVFRGPVELLVLALVMCATLAVVWAVTDRGGWKVSVHALTVVTGATLAALLYGPWAGVPAALAALAAGWSRVHLRAHTPAQVVVGGLLGATAAILFTALT
ncbi:hypothetical protein PWG71_19555 [Nocardiopsis sp. N85]|uniref:hypothetical protein n=1 Tax=Nocardiopsis sp. N85 TaxID=3029400 RepID=UPI00237EEC97|nr:hypothetical protein [Nocardiopsis sp. N85]MDE3723593.1 hypothetical protein [Nocardiopsis sp. N85]